jgi:hypothetical protein
MAPNRPESCSIRPHRAPIRGLLRNAKVSRQVPQPTKERRTMIDRPMTPELAAALAAMTPVERKILRAYAKPRPEGEEGFTPFLVALFVGLVAELGQLERQETIEKMHEVTILHAHELDHLADVEEAAEGADWSHVPPPAPRTEEHWPLGHPDTPCA